MARCKPNFDPDSTVTQFVSLRDVGEMYREARATFQRTKKIYTICRAHCRMYGGTWPSLTRKAKVKYFAAAVACRQWGKLQAHLQQRAAAIDMG